MDDPIPAIVLLSGGLDSATTLAMARAEGRSVHALSFRYGQRHQAELTMARRQAARQGAAEHRVIDLSHFGALVAGSTALVTGAHLGDAPPGDLAPDLEVPHAPTPSRKIPVTYVPARNTLFLTYALAWAEVLGAREIWLGINALDYSGYPDCRPEFLHAFERAANLATREGVEAPPGTPWLRLRAPLLHLRKDEIISAALSLGVDLGDTLSCYDPIMSDTTPLACGTCESCRLRAAGFARAGAGDPAPHAPR